MPDGGRDRGRPGVLVGGGLRVDGPGVTPPRRVRIPTRRAVTCALATREGAVHDVRATVSASERIVARVATQPR